MFKYFEIVEEMVEPSAAILKLVEWLKTSRPPLLKVERTVTVESMCSSSLRRVPSKSEYMLLLILIGNCVRGDC